MATAHLSSSRICRPEEDPFLLLQSTFHAVQEILVRHRGQPLRRSWLDHPYGEEEITLLEEDLLPALKGCLARIAELDQCLLVEMEFLARCDGELERFRSAKLRPRLG